MNRRERMQATLEHRQPDKTPYSIGFTQKAHARMAEFLGDAQFGEKIGNYLGALSTEPADSWKEVKPDIWEDQFGVHWDRSVDKDIGNVCNQVVTPENIREFRFPDPAEPSRWATYSEKIRRMKTEKFIVANLGFSLYERAWTLAGMEDLMVAMVADKPFAHLLFDRILEFNLEVIDHACSFDIDALQFGDDWGMQTGLIMGPELWKEFVKPRIREMYGRVKSKGKRVFIHSCGKVDELFPDLIECGLDVFNPFQPEVIDIVAAKRNHGSRLSFYGGISTQRTLPFGTVQEVKDEVRRLLDVIGKDGGLIASPAHAIPGDAKPENIAAMLEVLQGQ